MKCDRRQVTIGIAASVLVISGISLRDLSRFAIPTGDVGVFMVQPSTSILRFEEAGHGCGGPNHSWVTGYLTHNGKDLSLSGATYSSQQEATQELRRRVQGATSIQETGVRYNRDGQVVGERVVAMLTVEDREIALVVWTQTWIPGERTSVFAIESESSECALEFERTRVEAGDAGPHVITWASDK